MTRIALQIIPTSLLNLISFFFLLLLPLSSSSSSFNPIDNYLLTFTPTPTLTPHHLLPSNPKPHISTQSFSFSFPISSASSSSPSPHLLRLHFLPAPPPPPPLFNVSANTHFPLLSNFSPASPTSSEFIFPDLNLLNLDLSFAPCTSSSSNYSAYVNAIELYSIPESVVPVVVEGQVMEVAVRVNVGGPRVTAENDTMWRSWVPDKEFFKEGAGKDDEVVGVFTGRINFEEGGATREAAPESVYRTARALKANKTGGIIILLISLMF